MKHIATLLLVASLAATASAQDKLPPNAKFVKVEVTPASIEIKTPFEYRQLLITGILDNGDRVDVTRLAQFTAPAVVKVSERGQVRPVNDGQGELKFTFQSPGTAVPGL